MILFSNPPSLEKIPPAYVQAANMNTSACNQSSTFLDTLNTSEENELPYDHIQPYGPSAEDPFKPYKPHNLYNAAEKVDGNEPVKIAQEQLDALALEIKEHPNSADSLSPFNPYNPESPLDPCNPNQFFDPNKPHEKWYGKSYEVISKHPIGAEVKDLIEKLEQLKTLIAQDPNPSHHYRFLQTCQTWQVDYKIKPTSHLTFDPLLDLTVTFDTTSDDTSKTAIVVFQDFEDTELSQNQDVQDPS